MPPKKTILLFGLLLLLVPSVVAGDAAGPGPAAESGGISLPWRSDFAASLALAQKEGKVVLVNFTGSDWCVWCHRLRDEVFLTPVFAAYSAKDLILVELDFPRKTPLPAAVELQNRTLAEKYEVTGYPTILLLQADGKVLGRLGYMQGGPKTFVRELKHLAASRPNQG